MGIAKNVGFDTFPEQGRYLGKVVRVCFEYDTSRAIEGEVIRDDAEAPGVMLIRLSDGRVVLSTECQYQPVKS